MSYEPQPEQPNPQQPAPPTAVYAPPPGGYAAPPSGPGGPYRAQPPGQPGQQPPLPPYNGLAIFAFISSFFIGLLGLILSFVASSQLARDGKRGKGLAVAAMIIGIVNTIFQFIGVVFLAMMLIVGGIAATTVSSLDDYDYDYGAPSPSQPYDDEWHSPNWAPENMSTGGVVFTSPSDAVETAAVSGVEDRREYGPAAGSPPHVTMYVDYACPACHAFEAENGDVLERHLANGDITLEIVPVSTLDRTTADSEYSTRAANFMACQVNAQPDTAYAVHRQLMSADMEPEPGIAGPDDAELLIAAMRAGGADDSEMRDCVENREFESFVRAVSNDLLGGEGVLGLASGENLSGTGEATSSTQLLPRVPLVIVDGRDWEKADAQSFETYLDERVAAAAR